MNTGKYVFSQIIEFLPQRKFDLIVQKHKGNKKVKHFSCWNQLLCMIFGQLSSRNSLRDLIMVIDAHHSKIYHLGFGKNVSRNNLSNSNIKRDYKIFEEFAYTLINLAQSKSIQKTESIHQVYAFDSTTIDLCLNVFWWANFRKAKAGIKLHVLYDIETQIPTFIHFSNANIHDVNAMDFIDYQINAYYIFDKAYIDFTRLHRINLLKAFFVIRAKSNIKFKRLYSQKVDKTIGILVDQIGTLTGFYTRKDYPNKIRKIKYHDSTTGKTFTFLTNNFELNAYEIAQLYKQRWQIELFFKWLKQHLKIKSFWGFSENGVRIQIYTAIITYCLVSIIKSETKSDLSIYEILQIIGVSLLDKSSVNQLVKNKNYNNVNELKSNQLKFNLL